MTRFGLLAAVVGCGLLGAAPAVAAEGAPEEAVRHQRLGVDLGLGSAVGSAGVTYTLAPAPWFACEAGLGYGATGTQLSLMPKLALGSASNKFVFGAGLSLAIGRDAAGIERRLPWFTIDLAGYEHRFASGISLATSMGFTTPLENYHYEIADVGDTVHPSDLIPQFRLGVGYWF